MMTRMGLRFMPPTQLLLHMKLYRMVVNSVPTCARGGRERAYRQSACRAHQDLWLLPLALVLGRHQVAAVWLSIIYPSLYPTTLSSHLFIHLSTYPLTVHQAVDTSIHPLTCLSTPTCPSTPLTCLSTSHPSAHSSTHLFTCLAVYPLKLLPTCSPAHPQGA